MIRLQCRFVKLIESVLSPMASKFASYYASRRNSAGVFVLLLSDWPRFDDQAAHGMYLTLASRTARLRECYSAVDFLRLRILPSILYGQRYHIPRAEQSHTLVRTVNEELKDIDCRLEEHTAVLRLLCVFQAALASYQLGPNPPSIPTPRRPVNPFLEPQLLLGVFIPGTSYTYYCADLGFRSSGSHLIPSAEGVQTLIKRGILSRKHSKSHCESRERPSPFTSLTDNTKWLLKKSPLAKHPPSANDHRRVAFVNVEKLRRMSIIYQRSDLLAAQANITVYSAARQDGVKFTSADDWLVYDWFRTQG